MKKIYSLVLILISVASLHAQQKLNIVAGTRLQYSVSVQGRTFPIFIHIDSISNTKLILSWNYEDGRSGRFIATKSSIDSATIGYYHPPVDKEELLLPNNQHILFISKSVLDDLKKNGKSVFDDFNVTANPYSNDNFFKLNGQLIDALKIESESGAIFWVLNNTTAPIILKTMNNPAGVDVELVIVE